MANNSRTNRAFAKRISMEDKQNPEKLKKIVERLFEDALAGDKKAIDIIAERMDGKPVAEVHQEGDATIRVITGIDTEQE